LTSTRKNPTKKRAQIKSKFTQIKNQLGTPTNKLITTKTLTKFLTEKAISTNGCPSCKNSRKRLKLIKNTTQKCVMTTKDPNLYLKIYSKLLK
jgi:hypothetical protein